MAQRCEAQIAFSRSYTNGDVQATFRCGPCKFNSLFFPKFTPKSRMEITPEVKERLAQRCEKYEKGVIQVPEENINREIKGWYPQVLLDLRAEDQRKRKRS